MTPFTDSHCHLEPDDFRTPEGVDERPAVIARAAAAGVTTLIVIGSGHDLSEAQNAVSLAENQPKGAQPRMFAAVGIHPHDASIIESSQPRRAGTHRPAPPVLGEPLFAEIARLARHPRVVAVGESGLDYHYNHSTPDQQKSLMRRFCALSSEVNKPISLHIRDAHDDARRIVKETPVPGGVIHCFTGTPDDATAWLDLGFHISFSGIVTFKSAAGIQTACKRVPADRLLLETDCPFLTPIPYRGKRNEPAYLVHTASFVANLRGMSVEELAEQTTAATTCLFRLSQS